MGFLFGAIMTFSPEWEKTYKSNSHLSIWPWSDLVSFVMRYSRPTPDFKVLELGCGAGANIQFFKALKVGYYSIEGSKTAVQMIHKNFPDLKKRVVTGDFTKEIPFNGPFDLVVDRISLSHNTEEAIKNCLGLVREKMKPGTPFIGIDWFSTKGTYFKKGKQGADKYTRTGYKTGPYADLGILHFSDLKHLKDLFSGFEIERLEHKIVERDSKEKFAFWNFLARKV